MFLKGFGKNGRAFGLNEEVIIDDLRKNSLDYFQSPSQFDLSLPLSHTTAEGRQARAMTKYFLVFPGQANLPFRSLESRGQSSTCTSTVGEAKRYV